MTILSYILVSLLLVAAGLCVTLLVDRSHRRAFEKFKAEQLREANRPVKVWICRHCGFMSLMRNEVCTWCNAPRPEDFVYGTIAEKEFAAQLQKPLPKPYTEGSGKSG